MTLKEVMQQLESYGCKTTKNTLVKHGANEPVFGVKVADLKKILKITKKNHELSLELFATGNSDAMYLAGLMADETKITKDQLNNWAKKSYWYYLSEYAVPYVAGETIFGFELALEWIESGKENIASAGWATLAYICAMRNDDDLVIDTYSILLDRVENEIHNAQNRVRYTMNGFVIAVGSYIKTLTIKSKQVASKIGKVIVEMGGTACKVPLASEYILKIENKGKIGQKRKTARC